MNGAAKNTDKEIWRRTPGDVYSPSIHVTVRGDIGIQVSGKVIILPVEAWFTAGAKHHEGIKHDEMEKTLKTIARMHIGEPLEDVIGTDLEGNEIIRRRRK